MGAVQLFDRVVLFDNFLHALGGVGVVTQSLVEVVIYLVEGEGGAIDPSG